MPVHVGRKPRKDKGKPRNFRVFIRTPAGKNTKGRYFTHGYKADRYAQERSRLFTRAYTVVVWCIPKKCEIWTHRGQWARHYDERSCCIFGHWAGSLQDIKH